MYELKKKLEKYWRVNLLEPGPSLMKKEFTGPRSHKGWETLAYTHLITLAIFSRIILVLHKRFKSYSFTLSIYSILLLGRNIVVGIATRYGQEGPGIESRWGGEIFRNHPDRPWGQPSLLSFPGVKRLGSGVEHPTPSSAEVKERVELNLYSPLGLRGVFWGEFYLHLYQPPVTSSSAPHSQKPIIL